MVLAEIFGPDVLIVLVIVALIFGGSQLPKLARSLGSAKGEFEKGLKDGAPDDADDKKKKKSEPKALEPGTDEAPTQTRRDETTA
jgi:sec-independent protein translocase protein TatA